jgi:predicted nucleic-acid-binding protein
MTIVDANIVLRYLLQDVEEFAEQAVEIIENNQIFLPFEVVAEIVYVLEKVYKVERVDIYESLKAFFYPRNVSTYDSDVLNKALEIFCSIKIDFVDALLCGYALIRDHEIKSFDKKINKYILSEK